MPSKRVPYWPHSRTKSHHSFESFYYSIQVIYRIFLELFKSKSPLRECSQDHETEHRSVFPISVKDPSSSPPTLEWLISCLRLPLGNLGRYRDIISSPPCNLFHQSVSCFFIRQNELPLSKPNSSPSPFPSPFPSTTLAHQGALFPLAIICFTWWRSYSFEFENSYEISIKLSVYYPSHYFVLTWTIYDSLLLTSLFTTY